MTGQPAPRRRRATMLVDIAIAVGYALVSLAGSFGGDIIAGSGRIDAVRVVLLSSTLLASGALVLRRRTPWATFAGMSIAALAAAVVQPGLDALGVGLALYALAVHRSRKSAWRAFVGTAIGYVLIAAASALGLIPVGSETATPANPVFLPVVLVATLIGVVVDDRRKLVAGLIERAAQLEREREQEARLVAAAERARIAREMHDVVAHGVSVMVSLADGADAVAEQDPHRARAAVVQVGDIGRQTLSEMRRVLTAIGTDDDAQLRPAPVLADLPALIASYRDAGLPVTLVERGVTTAANGAQAAMYRIVQEGLTNALRHAAQPTRVIVEIDHGPDATITITDDGRHADAGVTRGSGRGLVGMRERARLWGGAIESGPRPEKSGDGWRVKATLRGVASGDAGGPSRTTDGAEPLEGDT